jgi:hypothetical protein
VNLIDYIVREVLSKPYRGEYSWKVKCITEDMGGKQEETIYCKTLEEAEQIKVGYKGLY